MDEELRRLERRHTDEPSHTNAERLREALVRSGRRPTPPRLGAARELDLGRDASRWPGVSVVAAVGDSTVQLWALGYDGGPLTAMAVIEDQLGWWTPFEQAERDPALLGPRDQAIRSHVEEVLATPVALGWTAADLRRDLARSGPPTEALELLMGLVDRIDPSTLVAPL